MTIQNIEDVMDRIMSLNKNLTEDSLRTLLSASGWDKEDILEGLHIFKSNRGNVAPISPIQNIIKDTPTQSTVSSPNPVPNPAPTSVAIPVPEPLNISIPAPQPKIENENIENSYSLNIKSKEEGTVDTKSDTKSSINNAIPETPTAPTVGIIQNDFPTPPNLVSNSTIKIVPEQPKKNIGKIIFFILLILVLTGGLLYLYNSTTSTSGTNQADISQNINTEPTTQDIQNPANIPDQNTSQSVQYNYNGTTADNTDNNLSSSQIADLIKEVNTLKAQVASYQKSAKSGQTIIKYLSQRGPTGPAGRGVASIDATTTGFLINYTDHTTAIIPYSTTTILNILNSGTVCFRDMNSTTTQPQTDVCLDRNAVIKILNK